MLTASLLELGANGGHASRYPKVFVARPTSCILEDVDRQATRERGGPRRCTPAVRICNASRYPHHQTSAPYGAVSNAVRRSAAGATIQCSTHSGGRAPLLRTPAGQCAASESPLAELRTLFCGSPHRSSPSRPADSGRTEGKALAQLELQAAARCCGAHGGIGREHATLRERLLRTTMKKMICGFSGAAASAHASCCKQHSPARSSGTAIISMMVDFS